MTTLIVRTDIDSQDFYGPIPMGALPPGTKIISVVDIDDPSPEMGLEYGEESGEFAVAIQEPDSPGGHMPFTLYIWNDNPLHSPSASAYGSAYDETNIPYLIDSIGGQWIAAGGKYSYQSPPIPVSIHASGSKTTPADSDETALVDSADSFSLKKLSWSNLKAALKSYFDGIYEALSSVDDGWHSDTDTWVYVSATSFKIEGKDVTARFPVGCKIKLTQTSAKYFYVVGTAFSTDTTVTVTGGSDYSLASAAITSPCYSYQSCPQGFPQWFNYTETWTGFSSAPTNGYVMFRIDGREVIYIVERTTAGTSNGIDCEVTIPITAAIGSENFGIAKDAGAWSNAASYAYVLATGTTAIMKLNITTTWTATGDKLWRGVIRYGI